MVSKGTPKTDVAVHFGLSRQTVYRILKDRIKKYPLTQHFKIGINECFYDDISLVDTN
jgi:DNA invertase Pin-like site-specific DNA recombinase